MDEDEVRRHEWAIELEIYAGVDEDTMELKVGSILHRIIQGKETSNFSKNDALFEGFDFGDEQEEFEENDISSDDLPF